MRMFHIRFTTVTALTSCKNFKDGDIFNFNEAAVFLEKRLSYSSSNPRKLLTTLNYFFITFVIKYLYLTPMSIKRTAAVRSPTALHEEIFSAILKQFLQYYTRHAQTFYSVIMMSEGATILCTCGV